MAARGAHHNVAWVAPEPRPNSPGAADTCIESTSVSRVFSLIGARASVSLPEGYLDNPRVEVRHVEPSGRTAGDDSAARIRFRPLTLPQIDRRQDPVPQVTRKLASLTKALPFPDRPCRLPRRAYPERFSPRRPCPGLAGLQSARNGAVSSHRQMYGTDTLLLSSSPTP